MAEGLYEVAKSQFQAEWELYDQQREKDAAFAYAVLRFTPAFVLSLALCIVLLMATGVGIFLILATFCFMGALGSFLLAALM
jgi:hypothetical protein